MTEAIEPRKPRKLDANDVHVEYGIDELTRQLAENDRKYSHYKKRTNDSKTRGKANAPANDSEAQKEPDNAPIIELGRFKLYQHGLFAWVKSKNENDSGDFERIGNYILPVGKTNLDGISCLLLEFTDSNGSKVDFMLECGELADSRGLVKRLYNAGYKMDFYYQRQLQTYLNEFNPENNIIATKQVGWFNDCFVLPHKVIGENTNIRYYGNLGHNRFMESGTLQQWQDNVAAPCMGFDILELCLYAGFSSVLVPFVGFGFGLHIHGRSSIGKTTAIIAPSSIFGFPGKPDRSNQDDGYIHKWNATHNGMEFIGYNSNHVLCALDEVNEAGRQTLDSIYMLVDGRGKARAVSRVSGVEQAKPKTWQTVVLSTGEVSIEDLALQHSKILKAGESVRLLDIEVTQVTKDAAHTELIRENSCRYYGTAGVAFIQYLITNKADIKTRFNAAYSKLVDSYPDMHSQASRVAKYFALMQVAGDLAIEAGILPAGFKPQYYTNKQFASWYRDNGNSKEKQQILSALAQAVNDPLRFIQNHVDSKPTQHYIGFYDELNWYLVPTLANKRLWLPLQIKPKLAAEILTQDGYLSKDTGQPVQYFMDKVQRKLPKLNKRKIDEMLNNEISG